MNVSSTPKLVTKVDIGRRVLVGGARHGTLRYVGKIIDKDGIFCGIELDVPDGRHNGCYEGECQLRLIS